MKAGRELDALIAICTKIMGWHQWIDTHIDYNGPLPMFAVWDLHDHPIVASVYTDEIGGDVSFYFDPFIKIADAWLVVERLEKDDWSFGIEITRKFIHSELVDIWECYFCDDNTSYEADADTAPLAICLAALDAMEEK